MDMKHLAAKIMTVLVGYACLVGTSDARPSSSHSTKSSKSSSSGKKSSSQDHAKCKKACLTAYQHCPTKTGTACVHEKQSCDASCK